MMIEAQMLALDGNCIFTPIYLVIENYKRTITIVKRGHFKRIKLSDAILVVNVDGYIGNSTKSKNEFVQSLNKEIIYYTDLLDKKRHI